MWVIPQVPPQLSFTLHIKSILFSSLFLPAEVCETARLELQAPAVTVLASRELQGPVPGWHILGSCAEGPQGVLSPHQRGQEPSPSDGPWEPCLAASWSVRAAGIFHI